MGWSIKKPLGGSNSAVSKLGGAAVKMATLPIQPFKGLFRGPGTPGLEPTPDYQGQYNALADQFGNDATALRGRLSENLTSTGNSLFQQANPYLLEDLNSRGLLTSSSAVNKAQADALANVASENNRVLSDYDTDVLNQRYAIKSGGMGAQQQAFQQNQDATMAKYLGRRQSRDSLISSILGGAGTALGGFAGRG